jgi:hypothetical protein
LVRGVPTPVSSFDFDRCGLVLYVLTLDRTSWESNAEITSGFFSQLRDDRCGLVLYVLP